MRYVISVVVISVFITHLMSVQIRESAKMLIEIEQKNASLPVPTFNDMITAPEIKSGDQLETWHG